MILENFNILILFVDVDECSLKPSVCGTAVCKNIPGDFECECPNGYRYDPSSKSCKGRLRTLSLLMVEMVGLNPVLIPDKAVLLLTPDVAWLICDYRLSYRIEIPSKTHGLLGFHITHPI